MEKKQLSFEVSGSDVLGVLHLPEREVPAPLVIISHGWSGTKIGPNRFFVQAADELVEDGYAVFRFDFRGSGDSDDRFEDQNTTSMLEDLDTVLSNLVERAEIDGDFISLIGHSQGGYISMLKASKDQRINSLILWMGRTTGLEDLIPAMWRREIDRNGFYYMYDSKITEQYYKDDKDYNAEEAIQKLDVPIGGIYGGLDESVPPSEGTYLKDNAKTDVEIEEIEFLDHYFRGEHNKDEVIEQTKNWLNKWNPKE